ncbi:MAG: cytidylate kinase-like family protein [Oscillospiraceae bacterium]|nr:cytidylate kinase-like family protein [Oscillospiraceae bacterium]
MVITISREYGAGGHSIGKGVAKALGVEFYDRDIIKAAAAESGAELQEIERVEEELSRAGSFMRMISPSAYRDQSDNIHTIEHSIILTLAAKGTCVILGRCADDIMEKAGIPSLDVFLYASDIHRAVRVSELIGSTNPNEIQKKMQHTDTARRAFYEHFTGKRWGDSRNYNLALDTGVLGYETCIDLICEAARKAEAFKE